MSLFSYVLGYTAALLFLAIISLNVYHALGLWALVFWLAHTGFLTEGLETLSSTGSFWSPPS